MALKLEELGTAGETFASFQLHQKQVPDLDLYFANDKQPLSRS